MKKKVKRHNRQRENWAMLQKTNAHKYKGIDDNGVDDVRDIRNHISPLTKVIER